MQRGISYDVSSAFIVDKQKLSYKTVVNATWHCLENCLSTGNISLFSLSSVSVLETTNAEIKLLNDVYLF